MAHATQSKAYLSFVDGAGLSYVNSASPCSELLDTCPDLTNNGQFSVPQLLLTYPITCVKNV